MLINTVGVIVFSACGQGTLSSDPLENTYIRGRADAESPLDSSTPIEASTDASDSPAMLPETSTPWSSGTFLEAGGLVVVEMESLILSGDWTAQTEFAGYLGTAYYEWKHGDGSTATSPAPTTDVGIIRANVGISLVGRYRFQFRSSTINNESHNDAWAHFPTSGAVARDPDNGAEVPLSTTWFKVYQNQNGTWAWQTSHVDFNPHEIYIDITTPGEYLVELGGRSTQFKIDRFVLYHSAVNSSNATTANPAQSSRMP